MIQRREAYGGPEIRVRLTAILLLAKLWKVDMAGIAVEHWLDMAGVTDKNTRMAISGVLDFSVLKEVGTGVPPAFVPNPKDPKLVEEKPLTSAPTRSILEEFGEK